MQVLAVCLLFLFQLAITQGQTIEPLNRGCFFTSYFNNHSSYYKIKKDLQYQDGLAACVSRLTRYMGIQQSPRSSTYNTFYCGNDLTLSQADDNLCHVCNNKGKMYDCGGNETMFVYLIKALTPLQLLLARGYGIGILSNRNTSIVYNCSARSCKFVDYKYENDEIITSDNKTLMRLEYDYTKKRYVPYLYPLKKNQINSLLLDFHEEEVYFTQEDRANIHKYNLLKNITERADILSKPINDFALDPYERLIFCIINNYTYMYLVSVDKDRKLADVYLSNDIAKIHKLAVDPYHKLLYGIVTFKSRSPSKHLVSWNYNGSKMSILFNGAEINQYEEPSGFDVFNGTVVWVTWSKIGLNKRETYNVHKCKLTSKCLWPNLSILYSSVTQIYDIKIYDPEKQTPGKVLCSKLNCQNGCEIYSSFRARCCSSGMKMDPITNKCVPYKTHPGQQKTSTGPVVKYTSTATQPAIHNCSTTDLNQTDNNVNYISWTPAIVYLTVSSVTLLIIALLIVVEILRSFWKMTRKAPPPTPPPVVWRKHVIPKRDDDYWSPVFVK